LIKDVLQHNTELFCINRIVAVSIFEALQEFNIPGLSIKWPNDIMSYNKKIGGILIENILKNCKKTNQRNKNYKKPLQNLQQQTTKTSAKKPTKRVKQTIKKQKKTETE
jgi:biotin-(acetyl-CoA carboxylase) ligase